MIWFVADTLMFADKTQACIQVVSKNMIKDKPS